MDGQGQQTIKVQARTVYGRALIYPVSHAAPLERLTGKKTLDAGDLDALRALDRQEDP